MSSEAPFIAFKGGVRGYGGGKLLAINPGCVAAVFSAWSKEHGQHALTLALTNGRIIKIREDDVPGALEDLGLAEYSDSWILNLAEDVG